MIISCPACESRFNIDPGRVPAGGRQVRCSKCGHVWRIAADGSPMPAQDGNSQPVASTDTGETAKSGSAGEGDRAEEAKGAADTGSAAGPAPPLLASTMTPNARQKLAEARKGKSRVRFLVIALVLMIAVALAVSLIRRPDGLNDALRMVPGLDESSPAESAATDNAATDNDNAAQ